MSYADLDRASALLQAGQPELAGPLVAAVLASSPDDFRGTVLMAHCLLAIGDSAEAVVLAERATDLRPDDASAWSVLCQASMARGLPALARVAADTARKIDPSSFYYVMLVAESAAWAGAAGRETIATAREAIRLAPDDPRPLVTLGNVYLALDRVRPAVAAYKAALAIDPLHDGAREQLADIALTAGDLGRSTRAYAELLGESPSDGARLMNLRISAERALLDLQVILWLSFIPNLVVPQWPLSLALGLLGVGGYLLWMRLRAGVRLGAYASAISQLDRMWTIWAAGLGLTLLCFAAIPLFPTAVQSVAVAVTATITLLSSAVGVARLILR